MIQNPLSLKEVQQYFSVPQHVLIHLCERNVIKPNVLDGHGRGKFRLFSRKNLFEFAVALELRRYGLAIELVEVIVALFGAFEASVKTQRKDFSLPDSLTKEKVPFALYLFDGHHLIFSIGSKSYLSVPNLFKGKGRRIERLDALPTNCKSFLHLDLVALANSLTRQNS
jgi:DNA-binding transcriptional MerR regulator